MAPRFDSTEPRRPAEAVPYSFKGTGAFAMSDYGSIGAMIFAGAAMITRYPMWCWFAVTFAISSVLSTKSLSTQHQKKDTGFFSGYSCLLFSFTAAFSIYSPILLGQVTKVGGKPFSFGKGVVLVQNQLL